MIKTFSLTVTGMKCGGCETNVADKLKTIDGVLFVKASSKDNEVNVEFDTDKTSLDIIEGAIIEAGFALGSN